MAFIGFLSFLGFVGCLVGAIVSVAQKNGKHKKYFILSGAVFVLFIISVVTSSGTSTTTTDATADSKTAVVTASAPAPSKAEVDAQKKAQADEKARTEAAAKAEAEAKLKAEQEKNKIPGTIGMNPEEFQKGFNAFATENKSSLKINNMKVVEGSVQNTFEYWFSKKIGMIGTINKIDGSLRSVMIVGQGDGTMESTADLFTIYVFLIAVTNPSLVPDDRGTIMTELGFFDKNNDINNMNKSTIRNGIKYSASYNKDLGLLFSAGDASEKK
jgi:hypothetical protein